MASPVLIALSYPSVDVAADALAALEELADAGALRLDDAALVTREADGAVGVRQVRQLAVGESVVAGGALGLIVGLVVAGPLVGAVAGMAGGAGWSARDTGLSDEQLLRFGRHLGAGGGAVFALVRDVDWAVAVGRLERYGGEIVASEVSAAVAAAFADAGS